MREFVTGLFIFATILVILYALTRVLANTIGLQNVTLVLAAGVIVPAILYAIDVTSQAVQARNSQIASQRQAEAQTAAMAEQSGLEKLAIGLTAIRQQLDSWESAASDKHLHLTGLGDSIDQLLRDSTVLSAIRRVRTDDLNEQTINATVILERLDELGLGGHPDTRRLKKLFGVGS